MIERAGQFTVRAPRAPQAQCQVCRDERPSSDSVPHGTVWRCTACGRRYIARLSDYATYWRRKLLPPLKGGWF